MNKSEFRQFTLSLAKQFEKPLPGEEAQYRMAPGGRLPKNLAIKTAVNTTLSAVLILLYLEDEELKTVLMERNSYPGVHSNQISFPGGRQEAFDKDFEETALREFREEVGIPSSQIEVLGGLTDLFIPPSGYEVYPFVGVTYMKPYFRPDNKEVKSLLFPSIKDLFNPENKTESMFTSGAGFKLKAPCIQFEKHKIWGATAMMISELEAVMQPLLKNDIYAER